MLSVTHLAGFAAHRATPGPTLDLKTGLVAYYNLDEASGQRNDSSGNGHHLTDVNTVGSNTGQGGTGTAAEFVAANSEWLDGPAIALLAPWEITAWVYRDGAPAADVSILEFYPGNVTPLGLLISSGSRCYLRFRDADSSNNIAGNTANQMTSNQTWAFVRIWHDGSLGGIQINANTIATFSDSFIGLTTHNFSIGRGDLGTDRFFNGRVQSVGIWAGRTFGTPEVNFLRASARLYAALPG